MSDKDKRESKVEGQPTQPLPMPEYRFQDRTTAIFSGTTRQGEDEKGTRKPDLSNVTLNLS